MRTGRGIATIVVTALAIAGAGLTQRAAAQEIDAAPQAAPQPRSGEDSARAYGEPTSVYNAHRVTRVINEGTHVVLADGTIWEIYLPDRPTVNTWRPGDLLIVRESSVTQGEFDYTLKDGRTRGAVYARLVGEVRGRS
jgi:hypothetical protein